MRTLSSILAAASVALIASCGHDGPATRFRFDVIGTDETLRPAMIVVNDDWNGAVEHNQFVNVSGDDCLLLTLPFRDGRCEVIVAPLIVEDGKVTRIPKSPEQARAYTGFKEESRTLLLGDPVNQLFVLDRVRGP